MKLSSLYAIVLLGCIFFVCCDSEDPIRTEPEKVECHSSIVTHGKYYQLAGNEYLWGGEDTSSHFSITNWSLDECKLHYGLGREHFKALLEPEFQSLDEVVDKFDDIEKVLVLRSASAVKVYPYKILVKHELINDVVDDKPVMVVYCFLADLVAVYDREYCSEVLSFGVSGYTYLDDGILNGLESFVLWDRDSESLWWPINDKAVSGLFQGEDLVKHDETSWEEMRWADVKTAYPTAVVLRDGQTMQPPDSWPILEFDDLDCN